jgi:hypothetical protein
MPDKKEPMISQQNRPTAVDFDMPIANFKLRDLHAVINSHLTEKEISKVEKETFKPEKEKEHFKPEKELFKPEKEKEHFKPEKEKEIFKAEKEKEHFKPEKEALKPEKELSKPEKPIDQGLVEEIANRVVEKLRAQGQ